MVVSILTEEMEMRVRLDALGILKRKVNIIMSGWSIPKP